MTHSRILIIGYGSTLRSDDGVGYLIAESLMDLFDARSPGSDLNSPVPEVFARQQLTPDLADNLSRVDRVIFVDACADATPGEVKVRDVVPKGEKWGAFAHEMAPDVLLDCVKECYGKVPAAQLITIGGECFDIGEGLSAPVKAAMPLVIERVLSMCAGQSFA